MKKLIIFFIAVFVFGAYNQKMIALLNDTNSTKFSFAVMGDNKDGDNVLKKIIRNINKNNSIKFVINNGDLTPNGYEKEFKKYLEIIKQSNKPFISVIGNHEIPWYDGETNYEKFFGKTDFGFRYGNSYFIILDTSDEKIHKKELKWLEKQLIYSQKFQHRFVITHVPLYDPRIGEYKKGHSLKNEKGVIKLNNLLDKYKVDMIFCSHIHFYYRGIWHKTPFIITGGAGAPLKHFKNYGFYNYVKVNIDGKKVEYKVVKINSKEPSFFQNIKTSIKDIF